MKYIFLIAGAMLCCPIASQTRVEKKIATKASGYGVTYSLPVTSLIFNVEIVKEVCKAGPYYKYAEKYLGVKDAVLENAVTYRLGRIAMENKGVPNADNTYTVEFKAGTVAPYVYLTEGGLLCTINAEYTPPDPLPAFKPTETPTATSNVTAMLTEELLMAGSLARQAEVAAKQIYHIRESKMDILTGDADNLPPDGEAMKIVIKQLEDQEKALTSLFTGERIIETLYYDVRILPQDDLDHEVLFRFSTKTGILDDDDLGGSPIYLTLKATERAPELTPKEAEKKEKTKGMIYNVPGKAFVEIKTEKQSLFKTETPIVQFGTREALAPTLFEDKKKPVKIFFYPETGAIKQIIQD